MIGSAIKKFANERGMKCDGGYAYGLVNGLYISLQDGAGTKTLRIYLYSKAHNTDENAEKLYRVQRVLTDCDAKEFRLHPQNPVQIEPGTASVTFVDNPGTMKRMIRYIDEVMPKLREIDLEFDTCDHCGEPLNGDLAFVELDDRVLPVHRDCVRKMSTEVEYAASEPVKGNVVLGAIGALIGALIGAIPWAIVYLLGYFVGILGFVIGALANFLYGVFGGKNSKVRLVVVVLALTIGVLAGQALGYTLQYATIYDEQGGYDELGLTRMQYIEVAMSLDFISNDPRPMFAYQLDNMIANASDSERAYYEENRESLIETSMRGFPIEEVEAGHARMWRAFISEGLMGFAFGILGCFGLFREIFKGAKLRRVKELA